MMANTKEVLNMLFGKLILKKFVLSKRYKQNLGSTDNFGILFYENKAEFFSLAASGLDQG